MTGPGAGSASRMRVAGIVLLAVAAVAAVVGLVALGSQGPSSRNAAQPATSAPAPPPAVVPSPLPPPSAAPPDQAGLPGSGTPGGAPPGAAAPSGPGQPGGPAAAAPIVPPAEAAGGTGAGAGSGAGAGGGSGGSGSGSTSTVPVRVLNNSMISGLAERAATDLRARGWNVVEVGNYAGGVIPVSTAYYRPGTDEEGAARSVATQLGVRAEPRFPGIEGASPGLIVIATNNWGTTAPKS